MSLKKFLNKIFFGITLNKEFICIDNEKFSLPLRVYLETNNSSHEQLNPADHLFLGYQPLVIGLVANKDSERFKNLNQNSESALIFEDELSNQVAYLKLQRFNSIDDKNESIFLFEGISGNHKFQSEFHQLMNTVKYRLTAERKSNVYLKGNLYQQLTIAYSVPRIISLISVSDGKYCNLFPTDLNGYFGAEEYIISLRIGGKASDQVESLKKIVLSRLPAGDCSFAYSLNKNHMKEMSDETNFKFRKERSEKFNLPIPENATQYRELELINSIEIGIHRLYFFKIVSDKKINDQSGTLAHIHRNYAEWRIKNSLPVNFIDR
jgi:hypothetical protein